MLKTTLVLLISVSMMGTVTEAVHFKNAQLSARANTKGFWDFLFPPAPPANVTANATSNSSAKGNSSQPAPSNGQVPPPQGGNGSNTPPPSNKSNSSIAPPP